jgi:anti-sigma regulatory factor (Ser/Thr protein kinase)
MSDRGVELSVQDQLEEQVEVVDLEPTRAAVGRARDFVSGWVESWGLHRLAPDASLLTSELVSNAVMHARTAVELRVRRIDEGLRIEVRDNVGYGLEMERQGEALLSRGLGLRVVAQLSSRWGIDPVPDGKTVWAELGSPRGASQPLAPERGVGPAPIPVPGDWPEVRLSGVPTRLLLAWEEHIRDLMREFALISGWRRELDQVPSDDPVELVVATLDRYWDLLRPIWAQARTVGADVPGRIDIVLRLPERVVTDGPRFLQALDAADELARQGRLLTDPAPREVFDFGRWFLHALVRQVAAPAERADEDETCPFPV